MILHDYCSCSGLGADGYASVLGASSIHGFDHEPQPLYPYRFTRADVMAMLNPNHPDYDGTAELADVRHASFPCQIHTDARHLRKAQGGESKYEDLLTPGLDLLRTYWNDQPWIVENVDDRTRKVRKIMAPRAGETLIVLCGTMFGLPIWRHRLFLANFPLRRPEPTGSGVYGRQGCRHDICEPDPITGRPRPWGIYHVKGDSVPSGGRTCRDEEHGRQVMGSHRLLPWNKLKEGFPPAYTSWIAADLVTHMASAESALEVAA